MDSNKKISFNVVLLLTSLLLFTSSVFAQHGERKGQGPPPIPNETQINKMVDDLASELSLSAEQKTEILLLYTEHFAEVKSSMDGNRKNREEMEASRSNFESKVKTLLNENQKELFDKLQKNNNKRTGEQGKRR
jgi:hypothetical protein